MLDEGASIYGDFLSMDIRSWLDIPSSEAAIGASYFYEIDNGLHVIMSGSRLEQPDGSVEILGDVTVPLNHGKPELYRVLRPPE
jgi:hypothetical protein